MVEEKPYNKEKVESALMRLDQAKSDAEKELEQAKKALEQIKKRIGRYLDEVKEFDKEAGNLIDYIKGTEINDAPLYTRAKMMVKKVFKIEPRKRKLSSMLEDLAETAVGLNEQLEQHIMDTENLLENTISVSDESMDACKELAKVIEDLKRKYKKHEKDYQKAVSAYNEYINKHGEKFSIEKSTELQQNAKLKEREVEDLRLKLLELTTQYKILMNKLNFFSSFERNLRTMISEAKKLSCQIRTEKENIDPIIDAVKQTADLTEYQEKVLEARNVLQAATNTSLLALGQMQKALTKVAGEMTKEPFIKDEVIKALQGIDKETRRIATENDKNLLNQDNTFDPKDLFKPIEPTIIDLETEDGKSYHKKEEDTEKKEEKKD